MNKTTQINLECEKIVHYKNNPNIIPLKNHTVSLFKGVAYLHCLGNVDNDSHNIPFNTKEKFYLLNMHGRGWCETHFPRS